MSIQKTSALVQALLLLGWSAALLAQAPNPNVDAPGGVSVNMRTGNLLCQRTDLYIKGQGLPLDLTFTYNSVSDTVNEGFGYGWTFAYNLHYLEDSAGNFLLTRSAGRQDTFLLDGAAYVSPAGNHDVVEKYGGDKFKLTTRYGLKYFFENPTHRKLTKVEDISSNSLALTYAGSLLSQIAHSAGRSVQFAWSGGFLTQITDSNGAPVRTVGYSYADGDLVQVTGAAGNVESYEYGNFHNLVKKTDALGATLGIEYNVGQKVLKLTSCLGAQKFTYSDFKTYRVEKGGSADRVTVYEFDEQGRLAETGGQDGFTLAWAYDAGGNVASFKDFNGNSTTYAYDASGNMLTLTDPDGHSRTWTYNAANRVTSETDKNGRTTSYTFNASHNLTSILYPGGAAQGMTYDSHGNLTSVTNEAGNTFALAYDALGNLTGITYPNGSATTFEYDGRGNVTTVADALGEETTIAYNALFKVVSVTDALGSTVAYAYDANGNAIAETAPNGVLTTFTYDALNRLVAVSSGGVSTAYEYDDFDNLKSITDAGGGKTSFLFDTRNLLVSETDALGNSTTYAYDGNQNVLAKTDANGSVTTYAYDALDRLASRSYAENTDLFAYDQQGNLLTASNSDISISYTYDLRNRLLSKTVGTWGKTVSYAYNPAGRRTSMTAPGGSTTTYAYDAANRLTSMTNALGTTTFTMDAAGRVTGQNNPNGTHSTYTWNDAGLWTGAAHFNAANAVLSSFTYAYDNHGNRLSATDHNGIVRQHFYDDLNRLDSVSYGNGSTEAFAFDNAGNRILHRENGLPETLAYNAASQLLSAGAVGYAFDASGNLTAKIEGGDTTSYDYDSQNRLAGITFPSGAQSVFQYDPFGNRISAEDTTGGVTRFFYDHANLLLELDESLNTQARYTSGLSPDSWISMERGGNSYFYHRDGLGSTAQLSNASGAVAQSYEYNAFGEVTSQTGAVENPFAFCGRERDGESGLQRHGVRQYDPATGRFTSRDNFFGFLRRPSTLHKYLYAGGNPASYADNGGQLFFIPLLWYAGAALVGAAVGTGIGSAINSQRDFHTKRNWLNRTPNSSPPGPEWQLEPDWKNAFHQPDVTDPNNPYPNKKYLLPDEYGGSSEAILQPDGTYLTEGPKQGSYNYFNPDDIGGYTGHVLFDVLPHFFNDNYEDCDEDDDDGDQDGVDPDDDGGDEFGFPRVHAVDPNEIAGQTGYDSLLHWVSVHDNLGYTIYFENDPDFATAPAQVVRIDLPVDSSLNIYSVRLGGYGFGLFNYAVPENTTFYQQRQTDTEDSLGVHVDVTAGIDVVNSKVFWIFESVDPVTGLPPEDALLGFLPVNDSSVNIYNDTLPKRGEGYVTFTITPQGSLLTGDSVQAQASIVFDINAPLETNTWKNLVDAFAPTSELDDLPASSPGSSVSLSWSGMDDPGGVGVAFYDLYASKDGGPFLLQAQELDTTAYFFTGAEGSAYGFYTRATDLVGNMEAEKTTADETVTLGGGCVPNLAVTGTTSDGTYRSSGDLTASNATVAAGSVVVFASDTGVLLSQNFTVELGAQFDALIEACPANLGGSSGGWLFLKKKKNGRVSRQRAGGE